MTEYTRSSIFQCDGLDFMKMHGKMLSCYSDGPGGVQIQIELNFRGDKTLNDGHVSALKAEEIIKTTQY